MNAHTVRSLLDPEQAAVLLRRLRPEAGSQEFTIESIWAKPGRHFNVTYRPVGETAALASLCVVSEAEAAKAARRIERAAARRRVDGSPPAFLVADGVLGQRFPFDYRIDRLPLCLDLGAVRLALADPSIDRCEPVAYRAGMRCQLRYSAGRSARAYGKIAYDRQPGRRARLLRELATATRTLGIRVPELLANHEATGLDLVAAVGGLSLSERLAATPDAPSVALVACALRELHSCVPPVEDRVHSATDELALAGSWIQWIAGIEEPLAARLAPTLDELKARLPAGAPSSFAHRDFHDKQILFDRDHLWLLDVDTACTGDPELDLGNFLAHLFLRGVQWNRGSAHRELERVAIESYGRPVRYEAVQWYRRASLARLACVYWLRPRWRQVVPALVEEAASA